MTHHHTKYHDFVQQYFYTNLLYYMFLFLNSKTGAEIEVVDDTYSLAFYSDALPHDRRIGL